MSARLRHAFAAPCRLGFFHKSAQTCTPNPALNLPGRTVGHSGGHNDLTCRYKLVELQDLVIEFQNKQRASKKQLQRLAGKLNWACRVVHVYGGRTFLRRILDTMNALTSSGSSGWIPPFAVT